MFERTSFDEDPVDFQEVQQPAYYVEKNGQRHCFNANFVSKILDDGGIWRPLGVELSGHKDFQDLDERFYRAIMEDDVLQVKFLIQMGANPKMMVRDDSEGDSVLHFFEFLW